MLLLQVPRYLPQLSGPLAHHSPPSSSLPGVQVPRAADLQVIDFSLALLVGEDGENARVARRASRVPRRLRLADAANALEAEVLAAAVRQVSVPLDRAQADRAEKAPHLVVRRRVQIERLLEEVVVINGRRGHCLEWE